jgi:hypothetical protein
MPAARFQSTLVLQRGHDACRPIPIHIPPRRATRHVRGSNRGERLRPEVVVQGTNKLPPGAGGSSIQVSTMPLPRGAVFARAASPAVLRIKRGSCGGVPAASVVWERKLAVGRSDVGLWGGRLSMKQLASRGCDPVSFHAGIPQRTLNTEHPACGRVRAAPGTWVPPPIRAAERHGTALLSDPEAQWPRSAVGEDAAHFAGAACVRPGSSSRTCTHVQHTNRRRCPPPPSSVCLCTAQSTRADPRVHLHPWDSHMTHHAPPPLHFRRRWVRRIHIGRVSQRLWFAGQPQSAAYTPGDGHGQRTALLS